MHLCRGRRYLWGITIAPVQASLNLLIKSKSAPPMKTNFKICCFTLRRCNYLTIKLWVIPPKFWNKLRSYAHGLKLVRNGNNNKTIKHKTRPTELTSWVQHAVTLWQLFLPAWQQNQFLRWENIHAHYHFSVKYIYISYKYILIGNTDCLLENNFVPNCNKLQLTVVYLKILKSYYKCLHREL